MLMSGAVLYLLFTQKTESIATDVYTMHDVNCQFRDTAHWLYTGFQDTVKVPFGTKYLDAALCFPASVTDVHTAVILTHGAGGDMNFKHLVSLAHALAADGFLCLRFTCKGLNLGYRVKAYRAVWVSISIHSFKNSSHYYYLCATTYLESVRCCTHLCFTPRTTCSLYRSLP